MDPATAAAVGEIGGTVLGSIFGSGSRSRARAQREAALRDLQNLNVEADNSSLGSYNADPALRTAQLAAVQELARRGREGGMTLEDRVAYSQAADQTAQRARGAREAVMQNMAARGMSGSGSELAAQLANEQGAAQANATAGAQAASDSRTRALQALVQGGQMAGSTRGQDFTEASGKAQAQDSINKFNASQRLQRGGMVANVRFGNAAAYDADANRWSNMGGGLGSAAGAFGASKGMW